MKNVLITTFSQEWDASEILSFFNDRGCEASLHYFESQPTEDELIKLLEGVDGVISGSHPFTRRVLYAADDLKVISRTGAGFDTIDLQAATERGIMVTTTPGANSDSVADFAMGLVLSLARQIPQANADVRAGLWVRRIGTEVCGKTLGIVGLGNIGKRLAKRGLGFDMTILAHDPYPDTAFATQHGILYLPLNELLTRSDFVSIHLPLSPETTELISERELRLMKPTAYLINTARGPIVDEASLIHALNAGWIAGAGLDVFLEEPPMASPLFSMENAVLSPHIAGVTDVALERTMRQAAENVVNVFEGKQSVGLVNETGIPTSTN